MESQARTAQKQFHAAFRPPVGSAEFPHEGGVGLAQLPGQILAGLPEARTIS
jgi:hypothetical protein